MFNLHDFVLDTIMKMIGKENDYRVQEYSLNWYVKSVLTDEDMLTITTAIEESHKVEEPVVEEIIEETTEDLIEEETEQEVAE